MFEEFLLIFCLVADKRLHDLVKWKLNGFRDLADENVEQSPVRNRVELWLQGFEFVAAEANAVTEDPFKLDTETLCLLMKSNDQLAKIK